MTNMIQKLPFNRRKDDHHIPSQFRSFNLLNAYRLAIAIFLLIFRLIENGLVNQTDLQHWFFYLAIFYVIYSLAALLIGVRRFFRFELMVHINVLVDVIVIACFTLLAGGVSSGLGTLVIAPIAGSALLLPGKTAFLFASYGTVFILLQELYGDYANIIEKTIYSQAGILGIAQFATAILAVVLAKRASESAALAKKRGLDLANLSQLNEHLINRIDAGIIVVDDDYSIKLINRAAINLLNHERPLTAIKLEDVSNKLLAIFKDWLAIKNRNVNNLADTYKLDRANQTPLQIRFSKVGARIEDRGSVIYLNDTSEISQQVQQSKLASLGRLTASISHEIRNPLGAISHAAQLLEESESLSSADKRLADIIHIQSNRLNQIIQNVLRLSRKDEVTLEAVNLLEWLTAFTQEFGEINKLAIDWHQNEVNPASLHVLIDSRHLHQILWNLCSNAIKYGEQQNQPIQIKLSAYLDQRRNTAYLDVIDNGTGVELIDQEKLFEPFYTTSITGTGLGLYISRELCLSNGGDLTYSNSPPTGSCFKIRFPQFHL